MIQMQTKLKVIDNSGAKIVKCIKILKVFKKKKAKIGDVIVVSVQKIKSNSSLSKVKKGEVCYAMIIRTKKKFKRNTGVTTSFENNSVVLLTNTEIPLFTRVFGKVPRELRTQKMLKLYSLSMGTF